MDTIISYIKQKYAPLGIIVYGSYADGSNESDSDFDALVITDDTKALHDTSFIDNIRLDVFVYPKVYIESQVNPEEFIQIFDGRIIFDTDNIAKNLKQRIIEYVKNLPMPTKEEITEQIVWCKKMLQRTKRQDAEGMFRWHWLLIDSLEIFCNTVGYRYLGPKKALKQMQEEYPSGFALYEKALKTLNEKALSDWIAYLENSNV